MGTLPVVSCAAILAFVALSAGAASDNALPAIDLQARCKKSESAVIDMMGDPSLKGSAFDLCVKSEQQARAAIQAAWSDIPPSYKSFCIRPTDYSASYVEWIACIEMLIDVKKLRSEAGAVSADLPKRCPAITYAADGSIKAIVACAPGGRR